MSKVIFFNIPASGHINPSVPVIRELVRRGEQVICLNMEAIGPTMEATGATFIAYPKLPGIETLTEMASGGKIMDNALALIGIAEKIMPFVLELLEREQPDYVIHDSLASWGKQAAQRLNIPTVAFISTLVLKPSMALALDRGLVVKGLAEMLPRLPRYWSMARRMKQAYGVKGVGLMGALMNTGDISLIFTARAFQPLSDTFDSRFHFVGPTFEPHSEWGDFPPGSITGKPVIYISLGTINNTNVEFYRQCFAAFRDYPAQFILSAGKRTDLSQLEPVPTNFIVRNFVPQVALLQRVDLFITHGGMNSVHEGLYFNVPLVVIPQQMEQALVAKEVVKHGAGVALADHAPYGQTNAAELRAAVESVMGRYAAFKAAAQKLGQAFRSAGGAARAAEVLVAFGRTGSGQRQVNPEG